MKHVIVTGGCGYIGSWACKKLVDSGYRVTSLDKCFFPSGVEYVQSLGVDILCADIRTFDIRELKPFDAVIHLAGLSNDPSANYNPVANDQMNNVATKAIVESAADACCDRFIFASSASVYGFNDTPKLTELAPINPISYYARSKAMAETWVMDNWEKIGGVVLRQATVMGWSPRHRNDLVVNTMVKKAIDTGKIIVNSGGEAFRPLVDVQDVAECYVRLLEADNVVGEVFNLCHRRTDSEILEGYTIACLGLWIKHILEDAYGISADVVGKWGSNEARSYDITANLLREKLQWEPSRGVASAVDSIMEHENELSEYDQLNINWMKALEYGEEIAKKTGGIF